MAVARIRGSFRCSMLFTGTTVFRIENGKIVEEIGEEGAQTALQQLELCPSGNWLVRSVAA
jgi:hypothetical protein